MASDFNKPYDPKEIEQKIYEKWEKSGYFNPDKLKLPKKAKPFTIVIPPPNITGSLHMGHALNATIQDIITRKKRMQGYKTLWLPGTDHAGIATQNVVEKNLLKTENKTRHDLGREKFLEKIWEWKEQYGNTILNQLKKLGSSCDWSRTRFTMDKDYQEWVKKAFLHYHKKGWIYRAERVINWCPKCRTSLSDLELEYKEEQTKLWYIKYPIKNNETLRQAQGGRDFVVVATTRPETMLADTAVAVNPKDARYKNFIGKKAILPIVEKEIPIISDRIIEQEFGTGAVKVTPAHSIIDAEIGERNNLPVSKAIGENGKMVLDEELKKTEAAKYDGLTVKEAREKIVQELEAERLIEKIEDYTHNKAVCYRCGSTVENIPSLQWFLKMGELAAKAAKAVKSGKVKFHPKRWEKVYLDWLKNIKDWCISRQLWWGHQIPIENSEDVLDTWFSSALWPFATMSEKDLKTFYPANVLSTARDIINLWVGRMVFSGIEFEKKEPFKDVIIHPTILTKDGKRMSKSLGTGIDPMNYVEKYGADATRFGLIWQDMAGQDMHWSEESVLAGKKFLNKIWNASRFVLQQTAEVKTKGKIQGLTKEDKTILKKLENIIKTTDKNIEKYRFGYALRDLYEFFWHDFCDKYVESSKKQMEDAKLKNSTAKILIYTLTSSLKLLHPFLPHITEEIWSNMPDAKRKMLIVEEWPE
ncbi:MAG: valine--tRNA ligase [Candidatus Pacebacteria bacterium]|nr:valine--tRNA ligase [Candidatus Paceibacterota bacterium]